MSATITTLVTDVAALHSAIQTAIAGFAALKNQIAALEAAGTLTATDAANLTAVVAQIEADTAALVSATTPAPAAPAA